MIVLGLDISSFQIDACLLVDDQPPVLRREVLGTDKEPLIERLRRIYWAVDHLIHGHDPYVRAKLPDWVVIEDPGSLRFPDMSRALFTTLGAITASIPVECQIGWRMASEWRHDLGAKNTKPAGHEAVLDLVSDDHLSLVRHANGHVSFDEHELDAIGIALAWRKLLAANAETAIPDEAPQTRATKAGGNT